MVWITACRNFGTAGFHLSRFEIRHLRDVLLHSNWLDSVSMRDAGKLQAADQRKTEETCAEYKRSHIQTDDASQNPSKSTRTIEQRHYIRQHAKSKKDNS
jgi:hypothetical protein